VIGRITRVRKRDGRLVDFDEAKIADAIYKAACAVGREDRFLCEELAGVVTLFLEKRFPGAVTGIEEIQDMVEKVLIETGHARMAKAYILYRDRRARAREQVEVRSGPGGGPRVGNLAKARVSPWAKARIAEALVREADLDAKVAGHVASSVEARVFARGVPRITTAAIRSLVEAELFERGFGDRVGRQALVGLPRYDLDRLMRGGRELPWRPAGPGDLKRAVADAVLSQYALAEVYGPEVVDAHLDGRLLVLDVGSPFEWLGAVARVPASVGPEEWIESAAGTAARVGSVVTRELVLESLVPERCEWPLEGGSGGGLQAARRFLAHGALRGLDRDGGRLRVALRLPLLAPDAGAARLGEAVVREHWARFRAGDLRLPDLVLHVPATRVDGAEGRKTLLPVLAAAAETGRVALVFDRGDPALVTPWFRIPAPEVPAEGALPVRAAVAISVPACAPAPGDTDEAALLERLDASLLLAVKALQDKRGFMAPLQADPGATLYRIAAGARPLVAGSQAIDLVHLVGVREAAARVVPDAAGTARLAGRVRAYAAVRLAEEGRKVRLRAHLAPDRDGEAAMRLRAAAGAEAPSWTAPPGAEGDLDPLALPAGLTLPGEVRLEPLGGTLLLRFPRDEAPPPETLYDACCLFAGDPRVHVLRLQPWPDRSIRVAGADL